MSLQPPGSTGPSLTSGLSAAVSQSCAPHWALPLAGRAASARGCPFLRGTLQPVTGGCLDARLLSGSLCRAPHVQTFHRVGRRLRPHHMWPSFCPGPSCRPHSSQVCLPRVLPRKPCCLNLFPEDPTHKRNTYHCYSGTSALLTPHLHPCLQYLPLGHLPLSS